MSAEHGLVPILLQGATVAADGQSTGVDCNAFDGIVGVMIAAAACGAGATSAIKVQHDVAQGGSYTDVPGAVFAQADNTALCEIVWFDINGLGKWIRLSHDVSGTYSSVLKAVLIGRLK